MKPEIESTDIADYNHLILYAKGWYQKGDVIKDVKVILGKRCMIDPVSDEDMWAMIVGALTKYANPREMERYLTELFHPRPDEKTGTVWFTDTCPLERAVKQVLTILGQLMVFTDARTVILNLGKPDPKILPLSPDATKSEK